MHSQKDSQALLPWWILPLECVGLTAISIGAAYLLFSILPISVAIGSFVVAIISYPIIMKYVSPWRHMLFVGLMWLGALILLMILIYTIGRDPFMWLLDWS